MFPAHSNPEPRRVRASPEAIEQVLMRLWAFYGAKMADAYPGMKPEVMRRIWTEELAPYSLDELERGVNGCRGLKWPPTLPEFMLLCRPRVSAETAYVEACTNLALRERGENPNYSHPAIFWTAAEVGSWDLRNLTQRAVMPRWTELFERQMALGQWAAVPAPLKPLPPPQGGRPSLLVKQRLAKLTEGLRVRPTNTGG